MHIALLILSLLFAIPAHAAVVAKAVTLRAGTVQAPAADTYWTSVNSGTVMYGGLSTASFATAAQLGGATTSPGRTCIMDSLRVRQSGYITSVTINVATVGPTDSWAIRIFRYNGSTYDFVSGTAKFTPAGTGNRTIDLTSTPLACQYGDYVGVWMGHHPSDSAQAARIQCKSGSTTRYVTGDITTSDAFSSTTAYQMDIDAQGACPFLAVVGDSIVEGHHTANQGHSEYHTGPGGTLDSIVMHRLATLYWGSDIGWQNHGLGGAGIAWVDTDGMPGANAANSKAVIMHVLVNNVDAGHTWSAVETLLNSAKTKLTHGQHLFVDEILPSKNLDPTEAATVRTWNANLVTWCANNGATLILCHDDFGQIRAITGELDDLKDAYDYDGTHLNQAGIDALAAKWHAALAAYY